VICALAEKEKFAVAKMRAYKRDLAREILKNMYFY